MFEKYKKDIRWILIIIMLCIIILCKLDGIKYHVDIVKSELVYLIKQQGMDRYGKEVESDNCFFDHLKGGRIIAHAGGEWHSVTYTNSYEAITNSLHKGLNYIEVDILCTSDKVLVLNHSWDKSNGEIQTYNKFVYEHDTPYRELTLIEALQLLRTYKELHLILDIRINEEDILALREILNSELYCENKDRIAVIINDKSLVAKLEDVDINWIYRANYTEKYTEVADYCINNNINAVCYDPTFLQERDYCFFNKAGILLLIYKENDAYKAVEYIKSGADGIFTDYINSNDLEYYCK